MVDKMSDLKNRIAELDTILDEMIEASAKRLRVSYRLRIWTTYRLARGSILTCMTQPARCVSTMSSAGSSTKNSSNWKSWRLRSRCPTTLALLCIRCRNNMRREAFW